MLGFSSFGATLNEFGHNIFQNALITKKIHRYSNYISSYNIVKFQISNFIINQDINNFIL